MCSPLKGREAVLGILYLDTHKSVGKFTQQDLQLLSIIGNQAGIAIENARLATDLEELFTGSLKTLVATIEAKDSVTSGHSIRVTSISQAIGKELGLSKEAIRILRISALLHDIGKVGVPESILGKPAPLSENEFIRIKEHPSRGAEIIENIKNVEEIVTAVKHHHERYDGGGIPDGLKGDNIPLISRIIAVADAYDAMTFDRPYRKGVTSDKAVKEIQRCSGTQFDPKIVEAFVKAHDKGMLKDITQKFSLEEGK
jgi:putative nucleotidyltransferase with HDIG domain